MGAWMIFLGSIHSDIVVSKYKKYIFRSILLVGGITILVFGKPLISSLSSSGSLTSNTRFQQYQFAFDLMADRPLLGWGWGYFSEVFPAGLSVHNLWLYIGASVGIPVGLLWVYLFGRVGITLFRQIWSGNIQVHIYSVIGTSALLAGVIELSLYPGWTPSAAVLLGILASIHPSLFNIEQ
jgi:O-antigen ligase